jgi:hypothetical protein
VNAGPSKAERCPLCGKPIDPGDVDAVQIHGGDGGFMHESCLKEFDNEGGRDGK